MLHEKKEKLEKGGQKNYKKLGQRERERERGEKRERGGEGDIFLVTDPGPGICFGVFFTKLWAEGGWAHWGSCKQRCGNSAFCFGVFNLNCFVL